MARDTLEPMMMYNVTENSGRLAKCIFTLFLVAISLNTYAQEAEASDSLYVVNYTTGPSWDHSKLPNDQEYFSDHSKHLSTLRKAGVIKIGARAGEKGIIVFAAKDYASAVAIINNDIAVKNELFLTDIQIFNVFYPGCVER